MVTRCIEAPPAERVLLAPIGDDPPRPEQRLAAGQERGPSKGTVLIVEDDYFAATAASAALVHAGYTVVGTAGTSKEAIELAVAHRPEVILMDIRLAGSSDGVAAAVAILEKTGIRSIFATAHVDPATQRRAAAAQPLGWLAKPYGASDLVIAVEAALRSKQ